MSTLLIRLCALLALFELLLSVPASHAQQPFTILDRGPYTLTCDDIYGDARYIHLENNLNERIYLSAEVHGSQHFSVSHETFSFPHDSSRWSLGVYFLGNPGDSSHAWIVIEHPQTGFIDSVEVFGFDARDTQGTVDEGAFKLSYRATELGTLWQEWDTVTLYVTNPGNSSINVTASLLSGSYGFQIEGNATRSIAAGGTAGFLVRYNSDSYNSASARVQIQSGSNSETISFIGGSNTGWHNWPWHCEFPDAPLGEPTCKSVSIINVYDKPMIISEVSMIMTPPYFRIGQMPNLPFALQPGDSATFTICFDGPLLNDSAAMGTMGIWYHLQGQSKTALHPIYLKGWTRGCISIREHYLHFDTVIHGSSWTQSFFISNLSSDSVTIDSILHADPAGSFTVVNSLPFVIPPHDSVEVTVRFDADSMKHEYDQLIFTTSDDCGTETIGMQGETYFDGSTIPLQGGQTRTLSFTGDSSNAFRWYGFHNNTWDSITVLSASLAQGTYFSIAATDPSLPAKLASAEVVQIGIQFNGPPGTYDDTLVIVTENGIIALRFPIEALIASSTVRSVNDDLNVSVFPNPSAGQVRVSLSSGRATSIEVLDVLGNVIAELDLADPEWNGTSIAGGTYFIRITGVAPEGRQFVTTRRVVIE